MFSLLFALTYCDIFAVPIQTNHHSSDRLGSVGIDLMAGKIFLKKKELTAFFMKWTEFPVAAFSNGGDILRQRNVSFVEKENSDYVNESKRNAELILWHANEAEKRTVSLVRRM